MGGFRQAEQPRGRSQIWMGVGDGNGEGRRGMKGSDAPED